MDVTAFRYEDEPLRQSVWEAALGLGRASELARMEEARNGLPATSFRRFVAAAGITGEELAKTIHLSLRTVQRRAEEGERLGQVPSERLVRLADLYSLAADVIGDDSAARRWMQTPREIFGNRTPLEMAGSELGARQVEDLLLRVEHGVFY